MSRVLVVEDENIVALAERLTSLGSLVSGVAHEINNPLSVIVANATFAVEELEKIRKGDPLFDEIMDSIKDIQDASERVRKIVLDLKLFSQPQNETIQPVHVHVRRSKVLVIDDEPMLLKLIQRTLGEDHDVIIKASSVEAFNHLKNQPDVDIVLCDLMMPEMTGMELYEKITDLLPGMSEKFVFMTGGAFTPSAIEFVAKVPIKHLDKPFTPIVLKNFVNEFLLDHNYLQKI